MILPNKTFIINQLRHVVISVVASLVVVGCVAVPWDKPISKHAVLEDTEAKIAKLNQDAEQNPDSTTKRRDVLVSKDLAVTQLNTDATKASAKGRYGEAVALYDRVLKVLPEDSVASSGQQELARLAILSQKVTEAEKLYQANKIEEAKGLVHEVLLENPEHVDALALQKKIDAKLPAAQTKQPSLKPPFEKPVTLELRDANIKVVFEALSRATGINFILDKDIKPDTKATIFIKKARIEDAIEMVLSSNGLKKKVMSENSAYIYPSTPTKVKDYQDLVIRSFYLTNSSAKQVSQLIKTMLKTKDIFVDDRLNMLMIRDTPEAIRIAEKLIAANDLADPEVMLEIEVLEISRNRLQELGIAYPNQIGVLSPLASATNTGALTLETLKQLRSGNFGVSPNPALNFKKTTGDINLLSNPKIRVKNNEKAKILVGDKVPIITTTSTANVGISESVQYIDVGLTLDVEPRITIDDFVNIKVSLEVSSLGDRTVTSNGAQVFTIGTRNTKTVLRLKDGETQILAGLISDDERKTASKVPALGDIPLLGRLFSNQEDKKNKTEIVLAITPRIIGNINRPEAAISEYWSGTESAITDKQQFIAPTMSSPTSPQERLREQIRQRQEQLNQNPAAETTPPVTEVAPNVSDAQVNTDADATVTNANSQSPPPVSSPPTP
jgi:general secretion pathway protein D